MAHKGAYVTNLPEFINTANQRYHHNRYIQQLQNLRKLHTRNRRCLPDPSIGIHSKEIKRPLPTSPCFQDQKQQQRQIQSNYTRRSRTPTVLQVEQDPNKLTVSNKYRRPVSPGRSILNSPQSRSRCSSLSRTAFVESALSNFNTITCFQNSPLPPKRYHQIPTVIVTKEGTQAILNSNNSNNMAPSSVHPVNRTSTHVPSQSNATSAISNTNHATAATAANVTNQTPNTNHLRKVTFKLPPSNNNSVLQERVRSAPPLYRSISESSLIQSTITDEQNEMPIQLRNQRTLPQKPLNKHPISPTIPIAKLRLTKELNLKENKLQQQQTLSRNSTMYNLNSLNNNFNCNNNLWPQRTSIYDPRYPQQNQFINTTSTGISRYSSSLPSSPSKRPIYNHYNPQLTSHQFNQQRHLSSVPSYQPVDCYTVGPTGILSSHGSRFPLGTIPPINSSTSPHNILHSPQTSSLPTYSQITKPSFLTDNGQYNLHRTGLYNPLLFDKTFQRLKQRMPLCKSAPLSSIVANQLPTTSHLNTHDAVTGLPRRRHTTTALAKSNLTPKTNLATGHRSITLLPDGTLEAEESPLTQMRKEIKYFVDERKKQLERDNLDINNLTSTNNFLNTNTITGNLTGKYLGSNSTLFNDQSSLSNQLLNQNSQLSPILLNQTTSSNLLQNRQNYLSSSESDLNALLHMYSYPPDPVLDRSPLAGQPNFQRIPQYHLNRSKHRFTVDDLRRHRNPLLDYYDDNLYGNNYYGNTYYDTLLDRNFDRNYYYSNQLPSTTYQSLIDWPSTTYAYNRNPGYYASTGSLRTIQTPTTLTGLNNNYNLTNRLTGSNTYNNYRFYDQDYLNTNNNYLSNDYNHHYSLDHLGLDNRTSYSRPASPSYYGHSVPEPAPLDHYTQHSLSTNHLDSIDLNNNLLSKSLGQTSTLPLRSYRL